MPARSNTQAWFLTALVLSGGCTPAFQHRAPNVTVRPARIAALPAFTKASEIDAYNNQTPLDAWTAAMAASLNPEVTRWAVGNGGHMFPETDTMMVPMTYRKFRKWTATTLIETAAQKIGRADFDRHSVDQWQFDQDLASVRQMLDADFALVTLFHDARQTTGRIVHRAAFVGGVTGALIDKRGQLYWLQVGSACLVDLKDGRMVWCNAMAGAWGDLSVPATAQAAVSQLLTNLYYPKVATGYYYPPAPAAPKAAAPSP